MTRSELVEALARRFPQLVRADAEQAVAEILDGIAGALAGGGRVEIRGFGSFSLNYRQPRIGRNPKTGEKVSVPGKYTPHFKAGKELRDRVLRRNDPMKKDDTSPAASGNEAQQQQAPDTPWLSERLSDAEIEALRQDQNEAIAYAKKIYPNLRIHRAGELSPKDQSKRDQGFERRVEGSSCHTTTATALIRPRP